MHEIFPDAPLYTSTYNQSKTAWAQVFPQIVPSFIQNLPFATIHNHWYTAIMPLAFESLNFDQYDIVISVTSGEAKSILTKPGTLHLCYCLTPTRYLWSDPGYNSYQHFGLLNNLIHLTKAPFLHYLRTWDYLAAQRPDHYVTICQTTQSRIQKYYRRESEIIYPPVDTNFFTPSTRNQKLETRNYYLVVSRLTPYKRVDLAIQACAKLGLNLKIAGTGPELERLKKLTTNYQLPATVQFLGSVTNNQLLELYQNCTALIMPQEEDFGLVALEAQACGKPVIAYRRGGATETIIEGKTGLLFPYQTTESLIDALKQFASETMKQLSSDTCRSQALKFSLDNFKLQSHNWVLTKGQIFKKSLSEDNLL